MIRKSSIVTLLLSVAIVLSCTGAPAPAVAPAKPAPGAAPAAPAAPAGQSASEWDRVVAAARQEGRVACGCPPVPEMREFLTEEFGRAFPGITLDYTAATLPQFPARVEAERAASQYLWDIYFWGPGPEMYVLADRGAFDPIVPALLLPEVADPQVWGGWDQAFLDLERQHVFAFWAELSSVNYNAKVVQPDELKSPRDLLDPKFKGKIVWWDPRVGGGGSNFATYFYNRLGEDAFKTLLVDQEPLLVANNTDIAERLVRGTHVIGLGADLGDVLKPYTDAGMQLDIRSAGRGPDFAYQSVGYGTVMLFNQAPHPNAAKVFLNWLLSRDVQERLAERVRRISRRADVRPSDESKAPLPNTEYFFTQSEKAVVEIRGRVIELAKQLRPT
jgi:iron(III) transport system substrate-binding protein